ncbi:P-loop containing nucleoside triphosphate hydrolase [Arabidopsis thaliana x Arabidopsis arenosa]|uniref:ADP-ribosyl cyclase/cyclic ADP-ribose hydrolase n=1 Tax=Arabidopsis thaliana x Arabidopsis arenosa TaxID=1240361 RepID=A0A8T2EIC0_9BRAS|nr:P-loop containing nucleoside triphosphate hydrolase [Arabidopsis thaliana x Arabidopsis arenosa]
MFYRKFKYYQESKAIVSSLSLSSTPSPLSRNWKHHVFPSFHGEDVRKSFLSHILKEFRSKGIDPFIDNEIERSKSIGPELIEAIRGSRIAIVLLSRNYASSSWCLNELVEIMKCREDLAQTVMVIFYQVDPTDVKKQAGDFGKVFQKTCKGKRKEDIERWRQALAQVAQIAGYHSSNWVNEAKMIEDIATDVSNKLINSTLSRDFDDFIGLRAHMEKIEPLLCIDSNEVRMIGIWGPPGIGKTTIARFLFSQLSGSNNFQHSVFMANIRETYTIPVCSDDYNAKLQLQQKFISQIINHKDVEVTHLGVAQERLKDKKVLVVLDGVDQLVQLEAMAKETRWFGHGSRIIITTQDLKLLKAHGINHIYKVDFPPNSEALEIFCMYAFKQKYPKDGFEKLAWEVTVLAGKLPLGLRVMGSYFRGMCKQEWKNELPWLRNSLNGQLESVLKFSYDALCEKDKYLFLHIACFFNNRSVEVVEELLAHTFSNVRQGLHVLAQKSLISINSEYIEMHNLLEQLGIEIVRKKYASEPGKQSIREPGRRQFLTDARDICEVLSDDTAGSGSVIGIDLVLSKTEDELYTSERAFERMSNLQFLRVYGDRDRFYFPQSLNSISRKIRLLEWKDFPMTSLPSNFNPKFLVKLYMQRSKLEKLWEGIQPLRNLKRMDLTFSINLKELPDLSTATNLEVLYLSGCSSLVELPFTIGHATNLQILDLRGCLSLVDLPSSVGNATNLKELILANCSNLVELPLSIGNLCRLSWLNLEGCSKLKVLPININLESLDDLYLSDCSLLKTFPEISTNIKLLKLKGTAVEEVSLAIRSWSRLEELHMSYCENIKDLPHAFDIITELHLTNTDIQELGPWVKGFSRLKRLVLNGMVKLTSLPQLPDSLLFLEARNCESLERLDCSFHNPDIFLNFVNCFKLNQQARDLIIQTSTREVAVLPGGEVPAYFSDRATGGTMTVKLTERPLHKSLRLFKACIVLVDKIDDEAGVIHMLYVSYRIMDKQNGLIVPCIPGHRIIPLALTGHLYTFGLEADVTSNEICFELQVGDYKWGIKECGVLQLS